MQPPGIPKTSRIKQLIPTYVNARVNGNNPRCQRTKKSINKITHVNFDIHNSFEILINPLAPEFFF